MSTNEKISKYCSGTSVPQIVLHYQHAMRDVYGVYIRVHEKNFPLFRVLEDDLRFLHIGPRKFAYGVANSLKQWVGNKGMTHVPMKVFCGEWAMTKHLKASGYMYVDISKLHEEGDDAVLFYDEMSFARFYIDALVVGHKISISDAVEEMRPYLGRQWLAAYENDENRPVTRVIEALCTEYGVKADSYEGIAERLRVRDISIQ